MPVETKLALRGLSRDVNGYVADQAGALRRAENVVLRAQDTAESRPNFDMYYESVFTPQRCKALVEFGGEPIAVEFDGSTWGLRRLSTNTGYVNGSRAQPVNYDQAEFAVRVRRRRTSHGPRRTVLCPRTSRTRPTGFGTPGSRCCVPRTSSSGAARSTRATVGLTSSVVPCARTRTTTSSALSRSERITPVSVSPRTGQYAGTRFYFPSSLVEGRPRGGVPQSCGGEPRRPPTMYPAWSCALTNADIAAGYFTLRIDDVADNDLGVALHEPTQQGVVASKYAPPRAQAISSWQRCMCVRAHAEQEPALWSRSSCG